MSEKTVARSNKPPLAELERTALGEALRPIYDAVVAISDRAGEALASMTDDKSVDSIHVDNLSELNLAIWRIRWELGLPGGVAAERTPIVATEGGAS